jgi:hypothetical protein
MKEITSTLLTHIDERLDKRTLHEREEEPSSRVRGEHEKLKKKSSMPSSTDGTELTRSSLSG